MIVCNKHNCWKINRIPIIELIKSFSQILDSEDGKKKTKQNKNLDTSSAFRHSFDYKRVQPKSYGRKVSQMRR